MRYNHCAMNIIMKINIVIGIIFSLCYAYQLVYLPIPWLFKRKNKKEAKRNTFAVLICGRNEAAVIGDLIDSIKAQTYDPALVTTFVMADNCTDNTAEIAKAHGAVVYTRFNKELIGKGYALQELLNHIKEDYPQGFDAFMIFDADNILSPNYIEEMNKTFSQGHDVITSYRNSKNYGDNWISAGYALWFLRESRYLNQARYTLHTSCAVSGTGFLFSRKIAEEIKDWPFHMLTEDIQFSVNQIVQGRKIAFCKDAELFDEQPVKFSQSWRQRLRWSKGNLQVFFGYCPEIIKGIFKGYFGCFDMAMTIVPAFFLSTITLILNTIVFIWGCFNGQAGAMINSMFTGIGAAYMTMLSMAALTTVTEWKHIHTSTFKKILYTFTFPFFMFTYIPISIQSFFAKCEWKPIEHTKSVKEISDEKAKNTRKERALQFGLAFALVAIVVLVGWINGYVKSYAIGKTITKDEVAEGESVDYVVAFVAENGDKKTCDEMLADRISHACDIVKIHSNSHLLIIDERVEEEKAEKPFVVSDYPELEELDEKLYTVDTGVVSTFDSLKRIKEYYAADKILIVTQMCHLSRTVYVANNIGLEAYGLPTDVERTMEYNGQLYRSCAEIFASVRDFTITIVDNVISPAPEFTDTMQIVQPGYTSSI